MKKILRYSTLVFTLVCLKVTAEDIRRYPSGLFQFLTNEASPERTNEEAAVASFLQSQFPQLSPDVKWVEEKVFKDLTHVHRTYALEVQGRRVLYHYLKTHFNRKGFLEYASSSWRTAFDARAVKLPHRASYAAIEKKLRSELSARHGKFTGRIHFQPTWWLDEKQNRLVGALDTEVTEQSKNIFRRLVVDETNGQQLDERRIVRNATVPNTKVYLANPLGKDITTFDTEELVDLTDTSSLKNSFVRVRREQIVSGIRTLYDVDPTKDYAALSDALPFSLDPNDYGGLSTSTTSDQPNPSFDAVNVYYHLTNYRKKIDGYFSTLGLQGNLAAVLTDPLDAIVNFLTIADGEFETNNAAYIGQTCRTSPQTIARCLVFFMPAEIPTRACGDGSVQSVTFYHLAREANVIVHEFQHYITDRITSLVPGSADKYNVGDALHEGYSDYFGASEVAFLAPGHGTKVGEYAFQNCSPIIRDVSQLREYKNDSSEEDPHTSGLSWASGLWNLRTEFGKEIADIIAYKSLFFLSTEPSFVEAVEALVKADKAQYAGEHVGRIRKLFYDEVKFIGGQTGVYRDVENGLVEIGFRGCSSAPYGDNSMSHGGWISMLLFAAWLMATMRIGNFWRKGRKF